MYNDSETRNKGAQIQPSARIDIHKNCLQCTQKRIREMGKYGISKENNKNSEKPSLQKLNTSKDEGIDEVDNIMSKFSHLSSKKTVKQNARRNSVDSSDLLSSNNSDNEDESDDLSDIEPYVNEYKTPDRNVSDISYHSQKQNDDDGYGYKKILVFIIVIIAVIISLLKIYNEKNDIIYDETKFHNDVTHLGEKYKVNDNSILQIQTGISTIFQRQDTGSFIFTYNSHNSDFNPILFNNFMNEVASSAARFLRNDSGIENYVIVESSKLEMRVHNELIARYQEDVTKTGVMLVKDLDEVPSPLAMAFHYYCDEFNPLAKRSAIFFTLNMAKCSDEKTSHASIEKCLAKKWTIVPRDNIVPLLTRIVSIVVDVTSVF